MANRIREWRLKRHLTQEELAEAVETTPGTVSRIESGRRGLSAGKLERYAKALRVNAADLLAEDGSPVPAGDAPGAVNAELLRAVISGVEAHLAKHGQDKTIDPARKSDLIAAIYRIRSNPNDFSAYENIIELLLD